MKIGKISNHSPETHSQFFTGLLSERKGFFIEQARGFEKSTIEERAKGIEKTMQPERSGELLSPRGNHERHKL